MATLDELQAQLEELTQRVNEITAPPDDYYTHRFSGEEIDNAVDRVKATPGSGSITAGDVGAAPAPLSSSVILYVNSETGSDENLGTQEKPFKTIQAAVNSLPKLLTNARATISLAAGIYAEDVDIVGFIGNPSYLNGIAIIGESKENTFFVGKFYSVCDTPVSLSNISFSAPDNATGSTYVITNYYGRLFITNVSIDCKEKAGVGVYTIRGNFMATKLSISNSKTSAISMSGHGFLSDISGDNNPVGIKLGDSGGYGGLAISSTIPSGFATVKVQKAYGSAIIENGVLV